jgi:hypothetical protein
VDLALVLDVLPDEANRAKDMAVWHQALVLPQLIATPIGRIKLVEVFSHRLHSCVLSRWSPQGWRGQVGM